MPGGAVPGDIRYRKDLVHQINKNTGHRIKYSRVDAETGEEVSNEDIIKGYKVDTDTYVEVTKDELENVALEFTRTIEIDEFVKREEIDPRYIIRPYYLAPDGKIGHDAYAVIRETIRGMDMVAIGRVVLTSREHIIALEPMEKGLVGTLLRYPYEVRSESEYFDDIQDVKLTKDMLDLAKHILAGDAWLVGRVTGQEFAKGKSYPASSQVTFPRQPWFAQRDAKAYGVVLDAHGKLAWGRSDIGGDPIVVVLLENVSDAHLAGLRSESISYVFAGKSQLDLPLTLDILNRELGVKRLLLEGGGGTNGAFLRAGLIDELSLILCPAVDGAKGANIAICPIHHLNAAVCTGSSQSAVKLSSSIVKLIEQPAISSDVT
jgi:riboflavin biosynthesis pyrimidine reductase